MVNFILCDDNEHIRKLNEAIISKIVMPYDFDCEIHSFDKYNMKLKNLINEPKDFKIYILDLEMPGKSGLEIAKEIRKVDWDSIIMILTSHDELELSILKQKLLILDFVSKFDNYEERLKENIKMFVNKINTQKVLSFKQHNEHHHVKLNNILYVYRDNATEKTVVVTIEDEYAIRETLSSIANKLDFRFVQTHRACFVNIDKIESVDFKNNIIYLNNDSSIDYLSRNYKKKLREIL